jgi:hypothetical protein
MLLLNGNILFPAGIIWSVVILSPTLSNILPDSSVFKDSKFGNGLMLGPLMISIFSACFPGGIIPSTLIMYLFGSLTLGYSPIFLGSVICPFIAAATATSGLHK